MKKHVIALTLIALLSLAAAPALADGIMPVTATTTDAAYYTIQRGDTLAGIARHFGVNLWTLAAVNGIADANRIYAGQALNIAAARTPGSTVYPVDSAPVNAASYTVQRGDILSRIASHFGVNLWTLAAANGISDASRIYAGQVLNIAAARPTQGGNFPVESAPVNAVSYTVQRGDNLFRIALHFRVNLNRLAAVNGISNTRAIRVGQVLNIAAAR